MKKKWKKLPKYKCRTCGKIIPPRDGRLKHCGYDEPVTRDAIFEQRDGRGRLHGRQPTFGSGEIIYRHGIVSYMDDGKGNIYDEEDPGEWDGFIESDENPF